MAEPSRYFSLDSSNEHFRVNLSRFIIFVLIVFKEVLLNLLALSELVVRGLDSAERLCRLVHLPASFGLQTVITFVYRILHSITRHIVHVSLCLAECSVAFGTTRLAIFSHTSLRLSERACTF